MNNPNFIKAANLAKMIVAIAMVLYHIVTAYIFFFTPTQHLNIHLGLALALVFLTPLGDPKRRRKPIYALLLLISIGIVSYVGVFNDQLVIQVGDPFPSLTVIVISTLLIIVSIEANRQQFGLVMPVVIILFLLYGFIGHLVPGYFYSAYVSPEDTLSRLGVGALGVSGIYGLFLDVSANAIFLFVVFGSLLQVTGATRFFMEVGKLVSRGIAGGSGLSAVVTSSLVGMVTGSVTANIATCGAFTIPFMRKSGYKAEQAGAIEAAASTGGQIMPPIMGSAAFLMAAFIGMPYVELAIVAFIPAVLYYVGLGLYVQFNAMKLKIKPIVEKVDYKEMALSAPLFLVPLALLIVLLLLHYSLPYSMSITIILLIVMSLFRKETRPSLAKLAGGITDGALGGAQVAVVCASLGVIESIITWRGLGFKIPKAFFAASGGNLILGLILIMLSSILLGMGVPTSAAYLVVVITTAPALIQMGVSMLHAHFFSFYFACLSMVTPPVAIGSLVAAKMAGADFVKTGIEATKACIVAFIVPYMVIWVPILMLQPQDPYSAALDLVVILLLMISLSVLTCGYYFTRVNFSERILSGIISALLFLCLPTNSYYMLIGGVVLFILFTIWQWRKKIIQRAITASN